MATPVKNWTCKAGDTFAFAFVVKHRTNPGETPAIYEPTDLTGRTFSGHIKLTKGKDATVEGSFDFTVPDPLVGRVEAVATAATMEALGGTQDITYVYDVQSVTAAGVVKTHFGGQIVVEPEVTANA